MCSVKKIREKTFDLSGWKSLNKSMHLIFSWKNYGEWRIQFAIDSISHIVLDVFQLWKMWKVKEKDGKDLKKIVL